MRRWMQGVRMTVVAAATVTLSGCELWCVFLPASVCGRGNNQQQQVVATTLTVDRPSMQLAPTATGLAELRLTASQPGTYALRVLGAPSADVTAQLGVPTIGTGGVAQLQLEAAANAVPGNRVILSIEAARTGAADTVQVIVEIITPFTVLPVSGFTGGAGTRHTGDVVLQRAPGFSAAVDLRGGGFPSGWSVTFAQPATTGSLVPFSVDVPATAAVSRYSGSIEASFGATTQQVALNVQVAQALPPADFSISASPSSISMLPGESATVAIALPRTAPGLGNIVLSASGAPAGLTPAFAPATVSGTSSVLQLVAAASAVPGTYPVVVTGTAGSVVRSTTVSVTIGVAPDFTLGVTPPSATTVAGGVVQTVVSMTRSGGVTAIDLDVTGLPTGATAAFVSDPATGPSSALGIATSASTPAGTYALVIRGNASGLVRTAPFSLTVTAAPPPPPPPPPAGITLRLAQDTVQVTPGASLTVPLALSRSAGFTNTEVNVTAVFPNAQGFAWAAPTPTTGANTTLQVVVAPTAAAGTYLLPVRGVANGVSVLPDTLVIRVAGGGSPDFALVPGAKVVFIARGSPFVANPLSILRSGGFTSVVELQTIGRPQNVLVDVTPASTAGSAATLSIYAAPNVPAGTYVVTIRGTSGNLTRDALLTLVLQ